MLKHNFKKKAAIIILSVFSSLGLTGPVRADAIDLPFLANIQAYTHDTLAMINNLPEFILQMALLSASWLATDNSDTTSTLQADFASLTSTMAATNPQTQLTLLGQLERDYFIGTNPILLATLPITMPYVNDLTFSSVLGQPFFPMDPRQKTDQPINFVYNYLKNISSLNITHTIPSSSWSGSQSSIQQYSNFFNTITAAQTLNGYLASDIITGTKMNPTQQKLMQEASNSTVFANIAAKENLGTVFRQLLLFNSQIYVMLVQLLQTQQKQLAAQTITNTLLVLTNSSTGDVLLRSAQGSLPGAS